MLTLINLPIVIWMLYTYFREIPGEILEASRMDGASLFNEIVYVLTPMAVPGIASTHAPQHHPGLERSLLDDPPDHHQCGTADGLHRLLLQSARTVLGEAVGCLDDGDRADRDPGLVQPETTRARPHLRRRRSKDIPTMGSIKLEQLSKSFGEHAVIPGIDLDDQRR